MISVAFIHPVCIPTSTPSSSPVAAVRAPNFASTFTRRAHIAQVARHVATRAPVMSRAALPLKTRIADAIYVVSNAITYLFPVWTIVASAVALQQPHLFAKTLSPAVMQLSLSALMLSTGLTLTFRDLQYALKKPVAILYAFVSCYAIVPALAILLASIFQLDASLTGGLILLGIISGGQASNLCTYIARGDTALSVAMTTLTTISAVFMLPFLSKLLLGTMIAINGKAIALSTAKIVLAPILIGAIANRVVPQAVRTIKPVLPVAGIAMMVLLILGPIAQTKSLIVANFQQLWLPVLLLHCVGGFVGYTGSKLLGMNESVARTSGFETGFKSPVLSYVLAMAHFEGMGMRLPSVISIIVLAPVAALFAVLLRALPVRARARPTARRASAAVGRGATKREATRPGGEETGAWVDANGGHGKRYRVMYSDGSRRIVEFEGLSAELGRARMMRKKIWEVEMIGQEDETRT